MSSLLTNECRYASEDEDQTSHKFSILADVPRSRDVVGSLA